MGKVYLVGAGPGDAELLTRKALRLIRSADVILHDSLVSAEILELIPESAKRIDVGKRRGYRLLDPARYQFVARLLSRNVWHRGPTERRRSAAVWQGIGRDPGAPRRAEVEFEIVPGISAAFGAAAALQVSLTDRALSSNVLFTTFSRSAESVELLRKSLTADTTVVVYMPGLHYADVSRWLLDSGLAHNTPCLLISKATQPEQVSRTSTAGDFATLPALPAPAILIVGRSVAPDGGVTKSADWFGISSHTNCAAHDSLIF